MEEQCFYCNSELANNMYHQVEFVQRNEHIDKPLCPDCYKDWLAGIKG